MNKEEFIDTLYEGLKESYPNCKETIRENIDEFEKGNTPQNIIWMWIEDDVRKWIELNKGEPQ